MTDLRELYQEIILDHNRQPRNQRAMNDATGRVEGFNPLCGDKVTVFLKVEDGIVKDVSFQGQGCAIPTASASLMTESVKGKTVEEVAALSHRMRNLLTSEDSGELDAETKAALGKLVVFAGVRDYPMRVKCATLSWHTLDAAAKGEKEPVSTE